MHRRTEPNRNRTWVIIGGAAATTISLGIAVVTRLQANAENQDAQTLRAQINSTVPSSEFVTGDNCVRRDQSEACDLLYRNVQAVERDRAISTGAFVAAGVLGVATVATALLWPSKKHSARSSSVSLGEVRVAPWFASKAYGLSAYLRF